MQELTQFQSSQDWVLKIRQLYESGLSTTEVSQRLGFSVHKVIYWMDKVGLKRRSPSQALYAKYNKNGDPFHIKEELNKEEAFLYGLGLGIYWGEGNKADPHSVRVANGDPYVLLTFIQFLEEICSVKPEKIKYGIICFNDSQIGIVADYWSKALKISGEQFGKIVQIPPQGKGTYRRKSQYGVCTVSVCNTKFKRWILDTLASLKMPS